MIDVGQMLFDSGRISGSPHEAAGISIKKAPNVVRGLGGSEVLLTDRNIVLELLVLFFLDALHLHDVLGLAVGTVVDDGLGLYSPDSGQLVELVQRGGIDVHCLTGCEL